MSDYIPTLVTIAVALFTAIFGIYSYSKQKAVDRENYVAQKETDRKIELRNRRMQEYERYLTAYRKYSSLYDFDPPPAENSEDRKKAVNEYWLAYSNLFHIASDSVLLAVSEFHNWAWIEDPDITNETVEKFKALYAEMIIEMRKDVSERTKLSRDVVQDRLPFNFSPEVTRQHGRLWSSRTQKLLSLWPGH